jgi:hypothetical protein
MPPQGSPKRELVLSIGLDKPTREIIAAAASRGVKVSTSYIELLKKESASSRSKAASGKKGAKAKAKSGGRPAQSSKKPAKPAARAASSAPAESGPSKAEFIRARAGQSPKAIAEEAKKHGMTFSAEYVSVVRSKEKARKRAKAGGSSAKGSSAASSQSKRSSSKSDFVRSFPMSVKVSEILAKAKAQGMSISKQIAYQVRSDMKSKPGAHAATAAPKATAAAATAIRAGGSHGTGNEKTLVNAALALGVERSIEILQGVRRSLAPYLG